MKLSLKLRPLATKQTKSKKKQHLDEMASSTYSEEKTEIDKQPISRNIIIL